MDREVELIKGAMSNVRLTTISRMEFAEGTINGNAVVVVQSGVGKVHAGICAQTLINRFDVRRIINTGVAGSLTDKLGINDFVVSVDAVQHDFSASSHKYAPGEIPYTGIVAFPADEALRKQAVEAIRMASPTSKALEGRVCSGDQFVETREQIDRITSLFGGLCAEMEGAAIAQVCYLNDTPYVIIRAISDAGDSMTFEQFKAEASRECANAVLTMVRNL